MNNSNSSSIITDSDTPAGRLVRLLAILLVAQIALAFFLKLSESKYQPVEPTAQLLSCDFAKINKVVIEEHEGNIKAVMQKDDQGWYLPDFYNARVSPEIIGKLFNCLKDIKKGFPVTTTAGAVERFKVSPNDFVRSVSLYDNAQNVTLLYLGLSPGFKTVYAKTPGSNDIYSIELPAYQITGNTNYWIDKNVAELNAEDITGVDWGSFKLHKAADGKWTFSKQNTSQTLHDSVAQSVTGAVSHVSISNVLGTTAEPQYNMDKPVLSWKVTLKNGTTLTYTLSLWANKNAYVLKTSDKNWYFEVSAFIGNKLRAITPGSVLKSEAEAKKTSAKDENDKK